MTAQEPLSFVGRRLPASFERRAVAVAPGDRWDYDEADWRDAWSSSSAGTSSWNAPAAPGSGFSRARCCGSQAFHFARSTTRARSRLC